jgi:hypothetical protein
VSNGISRPKLCCEQCNNEHIVTAVIQLQAKSQINIYDILRHLLVRHLFWKQNQ